MNTKEIMTSKKLKVVALAIGVVIIALVSFASGVLVGFKKAKFSYKFGENYERNFIGGPFSGPRGMMDHGPRGMMPDFEGGGFRNAHGIAGQIISVSGDSIVMQDRNGQENTVTVSEQTIIKDRQNTINLNNLKAGEQIVVMGNPGDNGTINANLIRIFYNTNKNNNNAGGTNADSSANNPSSNNNTNNNGQ
jgi:hypothetical protein